jgi:hypothetical protein
MRAGLRGESRMRCGEASAGREKWFEITFCLGNKQLKMTDGLYGSLNLDGGCFGCCVAVSKG